MATYILFWNPAISSYTWDRFMEDFYYEDGVGNWSFHEYKDIDAGDTYYMVKCGDGPTGIVMHGPIKSYPYESDDWSPKNRQHVVYADIAPGVTINAQEASALLTPEILTEAIPDFNWYGGHSGRRLTDDQARKLETLWFNYLDENPQLLYNREAWAVPDLYPDQCFQKVLPRLGSTCEICGYDYTKVFGEKAVEENPRMSVPTMTLASPLLPRLFHKICRSCWMETNVNLAKILHEKLNDESNNTY